MSDASQADTMVELALARNPHLFTDQYGDPYIRYDDGRGVLVTHSLRSASQGLAGGAPVEEEEEGRW